MRPVINATGVILHTNLGRAPMPERAVLAAARAARCYADLEVDRESGARGRRSTRAESMLTALTGAEDALVVNNCAAALMLALAALAKGKPVLVSRGELIEIGGEFRILDIMAASGAKLVEVGTTNRTRIGDYRSAFTDRVGAVLKVHPPTTGSWASPRPPPPRSSPLSPPARGAVPVRRGVGLLGRGTAAGGRAGVVGDALSEGADAVTFSGDKLLGGPQAGMIVGKADLIERLRRHPIARAVRVDTMQIAALEQVLHGHAGADDDPGAHAARTGGVGARSRSTAQRDGRRGPRTRSRASVRIGGRWGRRPRRRHPVVGRAGDGVRSQQARRPVANRSSERVPPGGADHVLFDLRTVTDAQVPDLARAIWYALEGDDLDDED